MSNLKLITLPLPGCCSPCRIKPIRSQTARLWLSQVNPFHGIDEEKIPRDPAASFVQSWVSEQGGDGNSGVVVGIGAGKGHTQLLPGLQGSQGMLSDQPSHGIMGSPELEGSFPQGSVSATAGSAQDTPTMAPKMPKHFCEGFQCPLSMKVTSRFKHLPLASSLPCLASRHTWI